MELTLNLTTLTIFYCVATVWYKAAFHIIIQFWRLYTGGLLYRVLIASNDR